MRDALSGKFESPGLSISQQSVDVVLLFKLGRIKLIKVGKIDLTEQRDHVVCLLGKAVAAVEANEPISRTVILTHQRTTQPVVVNGHRTFGAASGFPYVTFAFRIAIAKQHPADELNGRRFARTVRSVNHVHAVGQIVQKQIRFASKIANV